MNRPLPFALAAALLGVPATSVVLEHEALALPTLEGPSCTSATATSALTAILRRGAVKDFREGGLTWTDKGKVDAASTVSYAVVTDGAATTAGYSMTAGTGPVYVMTCIYTLPAGEPGDPVPTVLSKLTRTTAQNGVMWPSSPSHVSSFGKAASGKSYVIQYLITSAKPADFKLTVVTQ